MDFLWNKRHLQRSSFYSDGSTDFDLAFSKTNTHFCTYRTHKFIPWVAFVRKYMADAGHLKAQIEGSCTLVPKVIQVHRSNWQEFQCG